MKGNKKKYKVNIKRKTLMLSEYLIIFLLYKHEDSLTSKKIAEILRKEPKSIYNVVNRLYDFGVIRKRKIKYPYKVYEKDYSYTGNNIHHEEHYLSLNKPFIEEYKDFLDEIPNLFDSKREKELLNKNKKLTKIITSIIKLKWGDFYEKRINKIFKKYKFKEPYNL